MMLGVSEESGPAGEEGIQIAGRYHHVSDEDLSTMRCLDVRSWTYSSVSVFHLVVCSVVNSVPSAPNAPNSVMNFVKFPRF